MQLFHNIHDTNHTTLQLYNTIQPSPATLQHSSNTPAKLQHYSTAALKYKHTSTLTAVILNVTKLSLKKEEEKKVRNNEKFEVFSLS